MLVSRKFTAALAAAALCLPAAACGDSDVEKARQDLRDAAGDLKGNIDGVSKQDLRKALNDAEDAAKNGSAETKRKARKLERKIQRELNSRD